MLSCKDTARLLTDSLDHELPFFRRMGLKFHLMMCKLCRRHARQIRALNEIVGFLVDLPGDDPNLPSSTLSPEARRRIEASLRGDSA